MAYEHYKLHVANTFSDLDKIATKYDINITSVKTAISYCNSLIKLLQVIKKCENENDLEMLYIYHYRIVHVYLEIKKNKFAAEKNAELISLLKECQNYSTKSMIKLEQITPIIKQKYKDKKEEQPVIKKDLTINKQNPIVQEETINCKELYEMLKGVNKETDLLIIDIRHENEYIDSHICSGVTEATNKNIHQLNISKTILKSGIGCFEISEKIIDGKLIFSSRNNYDNVIIIDTSEDKEKISFIIDALWKYEGITLLKKMPKYLRGGYDEWYLHYPTCCTIPPKNIVPPKILESPIVYPHISDEDFNFTFSPSHMQLIQNNTKDNNEQNIIQQQLITFSEQPPSTSSITVLEQPQLVILPEQPPSTSSITVPEQPQPITFQEQLQPVTLPENNKIPDIIINKQPNNVWSTPPIIAKQEPIIYGKQFPQIPQIPTTPKPNITEQSEAITYVPLIPTVPKPTGVPATFLPPHIPHGPHYIPQGSLCIPVVDRSKKPKGKQNKKASKEYNIEGTYGTQNMVLPGLKNLGNTCFMNSILQCLSHTTYFVNYFLQGDNITIKPNSKLLEEYIDLQKAMYSYQYKTISPQFLKNAISKHSSQFSGNLQHDSQEFCSYLLNTLHDDLVINCTGQPEKELNYDHMSDEVHAEIMWNKYLKQNRSFIVDTFYGQFKSIVSCSACTYTSRSFDPFMFLTLPIPTKNNVSVNDCLEMFCKEEYFNKSNLWYCPKCKQKRNAMKQIQIWKLPKILIVHFSRFSFDGRFRNKLNTFISYPELLDMTNYVNMEETFFGKEQYELYAVSNHFGTLTGGHYTAFCKDTENAWLSYDDNTVTKIDKKKIVTSNAYLLFYSRVE